jgi:hypothetical protein
MVLWKLVSGFFDHGAILARVGIAKKRFIKPEVGRGKAGLERNSSPV